MAINGREQEQRTTDEHPYRVIDRDWTHARLLSEGARLHESSGGAAAVVVATSREEHPERTLVCNLKVASAHTYFVIGRGGNGVAVWVHNADYSNLSPLERRAFEAEFLFESGMAEVDPAAPARGGAGSGPRGGYATQAQLAQVRDEFLANNPDFVHIAGGLDAETGFPLREEFIAGDDPDGSDLRERAPRFDV